MHNTLMAGTKMNTVSNLPPTFSYQKLGSWVSYSLKKNQHCCTLSNLVIRCVVYTPGKKQTFIKNTNIQLEDSLPMSHFAQ